ncbi:MAG: hypothetical protein KH231_06300 [Dialister sp.]|uniref:dCTP deaminase n=1 Tax=Dialister sp. TaxID=1955814 RepID=UPI001D7BA917|nr:hypothetical protein [Dialister sp.]MBS6715068.1 hypothetical protein [Dialister sp.]
MILVDKNIESLVSQGKLIKSGFDEENLGSISYDLTIGEIVIEENDSSHRAESFDIAPGEYVFIKTKEELSIPENIMGRIAQKNSRMRMGLYVDGPHYHPGHITYAYLRVQNISSNIITIHTGDKIAQIIFEELKEKPRELYGEGQHNAFINEKNFVGMGKYTKKYSKSIQKFEKVKEDIESKESQIYGNVLTLMGIVAAVFSIITINFEAFKQSNIDLRFILIMNISLVFTISVFFGLAYLIVNKTSKKKLGWPYFLLLSIIIIAFILVYIFVQ